MPERSYTQKSRPGYSINNSALLMRSGSGFFKTLEELIDGSHYEIHFQTYIFAQDKTGQRIADALVRAARRGVKIFMLLDAYGSNGLSSAFINRMKSEKIELRFFGRLFQSGRFHIGRRLHRKVIVIDGITAIVSGINISDNYSSFPESAPWLDFSVITKGEVSKKIYLICKQSWLKIRFSRWSKKLKAQAEQQREGIEHPVKMRVRENDWKIGKNQVARSYYELIRQSQESLVIVGGYFLPGRKGRRLLKKASKRGVVIKLIVAANSDVGLMRNAMLYLYDWLFRNQVQIFEHLPSNVHGKVIVADKKKISIGSYDLNTLSTYSNIELNLDIEDADLASRFNDELEEIILKDCKKITEKAFKTKSRIRKKFSRWLAYRLVKSLFVLSIWLAKKDKEDIYQ